MENSFWKYIDVFSAVCCVVYAFQALILRKKLFSHHRYFFLFLANLGTLLVFLSLVVFQVKIAVITIFPFFELALLNLAPSMYLNVKSLVTPKDSGFRLKHFYIPLFFLLSTGIFSLLYLTQPGDIQVIYILTIRYLFFASTFVFVAQNVWYIYLIFRKLKEHRENLLRYFSYSEKIDLSWLKVHVIGYIIFISGMIIINLLPGSSELTSNIHRVFLFIYVNFIGINAVRQVPIYSKEEEAETEAETGTVTTESKELSKKQQATIDQLQHRFEQLIRAEQLYLDQDLTIFKLAKLMDSNTNYLSILINSRYQMNFANYINQQRIEYAKKALLDKENQDLTIEAIGNSAGFKSKSSFNAAFKKFEGTTPSEFISRKRV